MTNRYSKQHSIFLGAGCSKALGFPLTHEFVTTFEDEDKAEFNREIVCELKKAKTSILKNKFAYDVETLLDYLQGHSNPQYYMRSGGPFRSSLSKIQPITTIKKNNHSFKLKNLLEAHMIRKCYVDGNHLRLLAIPLYDRLLSKISGVKNWKNTAPQWNKAVFEIFTTNFDNSLDEYAYELGPRATLGYTLNGNDEVLFQDRYFENDYFRLRIYKLHGSVELSKLDDGRIISTLPPKTPGKVLLNSKVISKIMVYGIEKNLYSKPYLELLVKLKRSLQSATECTVVGYSFRDGWIKQIFEESINENPKLTINVVSPSATKDIKQFGVLKKRFKPIDKTVQQYLDLPVQ